MVRGYDGQIAALETQVQRLQSLKLVEQERVDRKLSELAQQQAVVEQRQETLTRLAPVAPARSDNKAKKSLPDTFPALEPAPEMKPSPISDRQPLARQPLRSADAPRSMRFKMFDTSRPVQARLDDLGRGLANMQTQQQQTLDRLASNLDTQEGRALSVLSELGIESPATASHASAIGGPYIPLPHADAFERKMANVQETAVKVADLNTLLDTVPVRFPVPQNSEITSPFGVRVDPFLHGLALHSGIDFRGSPGDVVRATAAGRVTNADYQGGYGLMVEINHGKGLITRYGHMSAIEVSLGQEVQPGEVVGRIGTTGRSTGPHLHYEVRVAGEAVDPKRYLRAGELLNGGTPSFATAASSVSRSGPKAHLISTD
jgi:murein DD-endopeptidase MepM/ murein hydrolase activator NlpD